MQSLSAASDTEPGDKFVITLSTTEEGAFIVQCVEFIASFARTRISLTRLNRLDEFFCPSVAAELRDILKPAQAHRGMRSLPDRMIRLPDVMMSGCRVMVMPNAEGGDNIIIRFRECYGAIFSVLHDDVPLKKNLADKAASQATKMLRNAFAPLFDLGRYLDEVLGDEDQVLDPGFERAAATINEKIKSLELHKFFLMRHLEAADIRAGSLPAPAMTLAKRAGGAA